MCRLDPVGVEALRLAAAGCDRLARTGREAAAKAAAESGDVVVADNTVETVPGAGIVAGYGPYVRNVIVSNNVVTGAMIGIGVTVVQEKSPGPVRVDGNIVSGAQQAIVGMEWDKIVSTDLAKELDR